MNQQTTPQPTVSAKDRRVAYWLVLIISVTFVTTSLAGLAYGMLTNHRLFELVLAHFSAVVGLPSAALAALCIVMFLEHSSGAIEFEGMGFKFKGASGPIVLWVFCFLAIAGAVKLLW